MKKEGLQLIEQFKAVHGSSHLVSAKDAISVSVPMWIDTGIPGVNAVLGNREDGIPSGKIIEIYGPESGGKSAILYKLLGIWQEVGGMAILFDVVKDVIDAKWITKQGVDVEELLILKLETRDRKRKGKEVVDVECMEDGFSMLKTIVRITKKEHPDIPIIVGWDDISATPPRAEIDDEDGKQPARHAAAVSKGMRTLYPILTGSMVTLVILSQVRDKVGIIFGSPEGDTGGRAMKHYPAVRVRTGRIKTINRSVTKKFKDKKTGAITKKKVIETGIECKLKNYKNKLGPAHEEHLFKITAQNGVEF